MLTDQEVAEAVRILKVFGIDPDRFEVCICQEYCNGRLDAAQLERSLEHADQIREAYADS